MQYSDTVKMQPQLLGMMLKKDFWNKHKDKLVKEMFPSPMDRFYVSVVNFHAKFAEDLDKGKLWEILKMDNPTLTDAQRIDLYELVETIKEVESWSPEFAEVVLTQLWKQEVYRQITEVGVRGMQGQLHTLEPLQDIYHKHGERFIPRDMFVECAMSIDELMEADQNTAKWMFNLPILRDKIGGLAEGQFGQIMARPDAGKTAFLTTIVCAPDGFADQGAVIDWYGNEEPIKRTRWRAMSAYTGKTKDELIADRIEAGKVWNTVSSRVRTFDIPFGTPVEHIMARTKARKPNILLVDQLDKLSVTSMTGGGFANEQERIRLLYIKFREIAKQCNCVVIGVCQASADAEGQRIVTYDMAENSKTGKAAECDLFLGIGRAPLKEGMLEEDYTRWLTVSKNKLDKNFKGTVTCRLEPTISRYVA
jgi:hypothetical protein